VLVGKEVRHMVVTRYVVACGWLVHRVSTFGSLLVLS
jgi:hypothetical protein